MRPSQHAPEAEALQRLPARARARRRPSSRCLARAAAVVVAAPLLVRGGLARLGGRACDAQPHASHPQAAPPPSGWPLPQAGPSLRLAGARGAPRRNGRGSVHGRAPCRQGVPSVVPSCAPSCAIVGRVSRSPLLMPDSRACKSMATGTSQGTMPSCCARKWARTCCSTCRRQVAGGARPKSIAGLRNPRPW